MVDVAIVGYGPVGATLAALLGRHGLSVTVVDRADAVYPLPRAVGFDHDAMRIFQRIGITDALAPHIERFREGVYLGADGQVIQRVRHMPEPWPLTWPPHFTCDQPGVEAVLREAVAAMPGVTVRLGTELVAFEQDADGVSLQLRTAGGAHDAMRARWLVACDGASSPVRRQLGIALENLDYDEPWIVVDLRVKPEHLHKLPEVNVQFCEPGRPSTLVNCPGTHKRWEFMMLPGEPTEGAVSEARLWPLLSRWLVPGEAEIWRAAAYRFHALVASDWRAGRVLLAGDAAHMTPPFLGQGMCQGLRDAVNLGWKLDAVVRGHASPALLDTYTAERRPNVIATTQLAKDFGRIISERDPDRARARDARILAEHGGPRVVLRQDLIPPLAAGCLDLGGPLAGRVAPQPRVAIGTGAPRLFDDLTGARWRLVLDAQALPDAQVRAVRAGARARGIDLWLLGAAHASADDGCVPVVETPDLMRDWLRAAGCAGALLRPDHYAYGGFADAEDAQALLDRWRRRPGTDR